MAVSVPLPRAIPKLILGQRYFSWFYDSCASLHTRFAVPWAQPTRMCSIDSVVPQGLHVPQFPKSGIRNRTSPTIGVLWMALKRNCWALVRMVHCLMLFHIVLSISSVFWYSWIASQIVSRFLFVDGRGGGVSMAFIPQYVTACMRVASLAPCRSHLIGMSRGSGSGASLFTPSFANLLLSSFPSFPLCPFTHLKVVADRFLRR